MVPGGIARVLSQKSGAYSASRGAGIAKNDTAHAKLDVWLDNPERIPLEALEKPKETSATHAAVSCGSWAPKSVQEREARAAAAAAAAADDHDAFETGAVPAESV